jgi:DNA processing protein
MEKVFVQTLLNAKGIGKVAANHVLESCSFEVNSADDLLGAVQDARELSKRVPEVTLGEINRAFDLASASLERSDLEGIAVIGLTDDNYPKNLKSLSDKPLLLYAKGDLDLLNADNSVAVIGTRKPSEFGIRAGERLTEYFINDGFVIISGLAMGCDTVAHLAALKSRGRTIAVLPSSLDDILPKQNHGLAMDIITCGGLLLSEYPLGSKQQKNNFIERNRIQSGLSKAVCVIETSVKGGTMHTCGFSAKQNRLLGVLRHPSDKLCPESKGNEKLLRENKAEPLGSKEEIMEFLNAAKEFVVHSPREQGTFDF